MRHPALRFLRFPALALLALSLAGCDISVDGSGFSLDMASGRAQDEWTRSYTLPAGGRFELINVNGKITAEPSDGETLEVRAERVAKAGTDEAAKELLDQIEMREEAGASKVRIEVRAPRRFGRGGHEFTWTVRVPRGVHLDLRTVNGGVRLGAVDGGEVRASSVNGGVAGRGVRAASLEASTTNGGIEVELASAPTSGVFSFESVNGGVELAVPAETRAQVSARCVNGGISVNGLPIEMSGEQSRRRLDGTINGGGARIQLETVNGGIRLSRSN